VKPNSNLQHCNCHEQTGHAWVVGLLIVSPWMFLPLAVLIGLAWIVDQFVQEHHAYKWRQIENAERQRRHVIAERKWAEWRAKR
jgi:hypothetical protein